jgi:hypothetical protein
MNGLLINKLFKIRCKMHVANHRSFCILLILIYESESFSPIYDFLSVAQLRRKWLPAPEICLKTGHNIQQSQATRLKRVGILCSKDGKSLQETYDFSRLHQWSENLGIVRGGWDVAYLPTYKTRGNILQNVCRECSDSDLNVAGGVASREIQTGEVLVTVPLSAAFVLSSDDSTCPIPPNFIDAR